MNFAIKVTRFTMAVMASGTLLAVIIGAVAYFENPADRNIGSMLVVWGLAILIAAIGCTLFAVASFIGLRRMDVYGSSLGFTAIAALFGGTLGTVWVLSHHLRSGVQPFEWFAWSGLGLLSGAIAALVWRTSTVGKSNA
ncbi:hypothetical protein ACXYL9_07685 [Qipengyuania sp. CAU 1752]